jgi:hypothetical protein
MGDNRHGGAPAPESPLSRPLLVSEVPPEGVTIDIVASPAERDALAALNGLPAVLSLAATLDVRRWRGDGLEVGGDVRARVRQTCVLTLEEFETDVETPVDLRFAPPREAPRPRSRRHEPEPEPTIHDLGDDPPDELVGGAVDLGAVVSEFLTLALDPYPHKPGARFEEPAPESGDNVVSPFANLRRGGNEPPGGG